jgi:integrase
MIAAKHRHTARFWVSLISLFSGMRLNEICALDTADLQIVDKVPCFLIRETADKSIKTNASERYVPAHQRLIEAGLLQFVEGRKANGIKKLLGLFVSRRRVPRPTICQNLVYE